MVGSVSPRFVQEIDVSVLRSLWNFLHGHAVFLKMLHAVSSKRMGNSSRVTRDAVSKIKQRHRLRLADVDPVRRLVDRADMFCNWIRVSQDEFDTCRCLQASEGDSQDSTFAVFREFI